MSSRPSGTTLAAALTGLGALLLYAWSASPWVGHEDVAEFQTLSVVPGIAHAGYPLLTLALELAHRLVPFGSIAYRANLVSAVCGALAVALAVFSIAKFTASRAAGVVAGLTLALSYSMWRESTRAEVYAFSLPLAAGAFLALARWMVHERRSSLFLTFLLLGVGFTSHLGILAIAIVATAVLLARFFLRQADGRDLALAVLAFLCGLTPFVVLLARDVPGAPMNYIDSTFDRWSGSYIPWSPDLLPRFRRLALLVSGRQFLEASAAFRPFVDLALRMKLLALGVALNDLPLIGALAAIAGAAIALLRKTARDFLLLAWLAALLFLVAYAAYPDVLSSFFLPGLWILAHFVGLALSKLVPRPVPLAVAATLLIGAAIARPALKSPPAPLEGRPLVASVWRQVPEEWSPFAADRSWHRFGTGVMGIAPARSMILYCWDEGTPLLYFVYAKRVRTDVVPKPACGSVERLEAAVAEARREGRPVYTVIPPERLPGGHAWDLAGEWKRGRLWRLRP